MIKLIASDMDGTLLSSHLDISELNKQAIQEARDQGIEFMIATGRAIAEATPVLEEAGIKCTLISGNGAQAFDEEGNVLFTVPIDKGTIKEIMAVLRANGLYFEMMTTNGVYSESRPERLEKLATLLAKQIPHITYKMAIAMASTQIELLTINYVEDYMSLLEDDSIEILKIITFCEEGQEVLQPIGEQISQLGQLAITSSFSNNLEVNHADAQKGIAVERIAKMRGIDMAEVMTIGDNYNDVSMLAKAGVSFAMGNAEEGVKKVAKYETDLNVNDGVGKAIRRAIAEDL